LVSSATSAKMGINYADLEPVNEFCNWVWVPGFCYQSLAGPDFDRTVFSDLLLFSVMCENLLLECLTGLFKVII